MIIFIIIYFLLSRPSVYIIKTNSIAETQELLKSNTVSSRVISENIPSVVDNTGKYRRARARV